MDKNFLERNWIIEICFEPECFSAYVLSAVLKIDAQTLKNLR